MKDKLYFIGFVFMGIVAEYLLITRLHIGFVDILLLAAFGVGYAGAVVFGLRLFTKKKDSQ